MFSSSRTAAVHIVLSSETLITDYLVFFVSIGVQSLVSYLRKSASICGPFVTDFGIPGSVFVM
jgi:hypothetical protein